ncbi:MAG: LysM peptidoglycan-binding domain-containing protein [Planctomycetota bacterium]|jgi:nucleoid-associated protein YgaU
MKRLALLMAVLGIAALCAGGCDKSAQKQNQELTQRVAELEYQLEQAEAIISTAAANAQTVAGESVYIVVQGDSLWGIAKKQLGSGARYKEILALNRHITKDTPLAIGTKLKMPPQ